MVQVLPVVLYGEKLRRLLEALWLRDLALRLKSRLSKLSRIKELAAYSIEAELRSIKQVDSPIALAQTKRLAEQLAEFGSDFIPVYGDAKGFYEAEDPFDYAMASIGLIPGAGDAAQKF